MTITKNQDGGTLNVMVEGRLDTNTAPQLEEDLKSSLDGVTELVFDFSKLEYISSAGLRVLLSNQKVMNKQGSMKVTNVGSEIMEIFDVTGFSDILTIA
ncbi:MAG: STAS domain-containing protein [Eubacterium sp.]|nr:STAS domain-containing protein [Eubacterium sp.]